MKFLFRQYSSVFITGMALRKVCVLDSGALVVRRFTYANSFAYAIRAGAKNRVRVRKSRTQNRIAYANRT